MIEARTDALPGERARGALDAMYLFSICCRRRPGDH
jgi:hypothetical protein